MTTKAAAGAVHGSLKSVKGVTFRAFRDEGDYASMIRVHVAGRDYDKVDPISNFEYSPNPADLEWFRGSFYMPEDTARDLIIAEIDGEVVGYGACRYWVEPAVGVALYLSLGHVMPDHRGKGIGTAMIEWCERRSREQALEQPTPYVAYFGANATSTEKEATHLLIDRGYEPRYTVLYFERPNLDHLPFALMPEGVRILPIHREQYAGIGRAYKEAYANSPGDADTEWITAPDGLASFVKRFDRTISRVAWADGKVAGMVMCSVPNIYGHLDEVNVAPAWRRRGLAKALIVQSLRAMKEKGIRSVRVRTLASNASNASQLYLGLGFKVIKEFPRYWKKMDV